MIEPILKIPDAILNGQLESNDKFNDKQIFLAVFLDDNFKMEHIEKGTLLEISKKNNLSELQRDLFLKYSDYLGSNQFGNMKYGRKGIGGQFGLFTCSLLHFNLSEKLYASIITDNKTEKIENTLNSLEDRNKSEIVLFDKFPEMKDKIKKVILELFISKSLPERLKSLNLELNIKKVVLIPSTDEFISKYNQFHKEYINIKSNRLDNKERYNFNIDTSENYDAQLNQLYSKFNDNEKTIIQDETCNQITTEQYLKLELFMKVLLKNKVRILPLPAFGVSINSNIYSICFSNKSLLRKLKEIYTNYGNKPFNYVLISNFDGLRVERVINYNFDTTPLINKEVYFLDFNKSTNKNETTEIHNSRREHDKFELLYDISHLFWNFKEESDTEDKQNSFFSPEIKNCPYLDQLLKETSESIINLIFKGNNSLIKYQLKNIICKILIGTFSVKELRSKSNFQMKKILLIYFKYEGDAKMVSKVKKIEDSIKQLAHEENEKIEDDETAAYLAGQIIYYLLSDTSSSNSKLELMTKYLISVNSMTQLKDKICELTSKYSHQIFGDNKIWRNINQKFLQYSFNNNKFRDHQILFFTGFYANNIFFTKTNNVVGGN